MKPLLIVKTGTAPPPVARRRGDFEDWIRAGLELSASATRVVSPWRDEALPRAGDFAGIVVTGSAAMLTDREAWSERTAAWISGVVAAGVPLLGICYGHQLLAEALGGRVGKNPRGREIGTVEVRTRPSVADPLLSLLPETARLQSTHVESVLALPAGVTSAAATDRDPHTAFAAGPRAWGVQFHPEFDADIMRGYLEARRDILSREGLDPAALISSAEDAPHGAALLRRFAEIAASSPD